MRHIDQGQASFIIIIIIIFITIIIQSSIQNSLETVLGKMSCNPFNTGIQSSLLTDLGTSLLFVLPLSGHSSRYILPGNGPVTTLWRTDVLSELHMQISQGWLGPAPLCHYSHSDEWQGWWLPGAAGVGLVYTLLAFQRRAFSGLLCLYEQRRVRGGSESSSP